MIEREDYKLKIMMNGVDIGLDNSYFVSFTLIENLNYNFYFAELGLKQNLYWDFLWTTREEVTIDIQYQKGDTVSLHQQAKSETKSYEHKTYNFLIYNYVLSSDTILITLVPSYFPKLFVEKITAGYNEKMEEVVSEICNNMGVKVATESTHASKRLLLQLGQNNLSFLRSITEYSKGYIFFINKNDTAFFKSYKTLSGADPVLRIHNSSMNGLKFENDIYALQAMNGLGGTEWYFDWDGGTMKNYINNSSQYGTYSGDVNPQNNLLMGNPIGKDLYPEVTYNQNLLDNMILNSNQFKVFMSFNVFGIYNVMAGNTVYLEFMRKTTMNKNDHLTGNYLVYSVAYVFENKASTQFICSSPFLFHTVPNFNGKNI